MKETKHGNQIWVAFNYLPGGQVTMQHFEDLEGEKKVGSEKEVSVVVTALEQVEAFKKQPNVAINVKGKLVRNEVLVYDGSSLRNNPNAADVVYDWAVKKGLSGIVAGSSQQGDKVKSYEHSARIDSLEKDVTEVKGTLAEILQLLQAKVAVTAPAA